MNMVEIHRHSVEEAKSSHSDSFGSWMHLLVGGGCRRCTCRSRTNTLPQRLVNQSSCQILAVLFHFVKHLSRGQIWTQDESWLHLKFEVNILLLFSLSAEPCSVQNVRLVDRWCDARHRCIPLPGLKRSVERMTLTYFYQFLFGCVYKWRFISTCPSEVSEKHLCWSEDGQLFKNWLITILLYFLYEHGDEHGQNLGL